MFKLFEIIENYSKLIAENLARSINRKQFIGTLVGGLFLSILSITTNPFRAFAANTGWCEVSAHTSGTCGPPGAGFCSNLNATCPSSTSTAKCPTGFSVNYKYYPKTACWCYFTPGWAKVCCDCKRNSDGKECGCEFNFRTA
ncbi:hypothetical protein ACFW35_04925 [Fictibacillus sp. NPDC058756]|uniref:hypothetical protein n=1 Tax=Fictibacillus sp. NPDC058756 TaxID=3346625 RepID=UPI00367A6CD9